MHETNVCARNHSKNISANRPWNAFESHAIIVYDLEFSFRALRSPDIADQKEERWIWKYRPCVVAMFVSCCVFI